MNKKSLSLIQQISQGFSIQGVASALYVLRSTYPQNRRGVPRA